MAQGFARIFSLAGGAMIMFVPSLPLYAQGEDPMAVRAYDIASQPLSDALAIYEDQTGVDLHFDANLVRDKQSGSVIGGYRLDAALRSLLRDTGLIARKRPDGDIEIVLPDKSMEPPKGKEDSANKR